MFGRDTNETNIMMDPSRLYPNSYHPLAQDHNRNFKGRAKYFTRTQYPPKYYIIDFGISRRYTPEQLPARELPVHGGDKTVPEFRNYDEPCDPFPTDIYYLGNLIREQFIAVSRFPSLCFASDD